MFIEVIVDLKEGIIELPSETNYNSDMVGDHTLRYIKLKGVSMVDVRSITYDHRHKGYDVVICLRSDYLGEEGKKRLRIQTVKGDI